MKFEKKRGAESKNLYEKSGDVRVDDNSVLVCKIFEIFLFFFTLSVLRIVGYLQKFFIHFFHSILACKKAISLACWASSWLFTVFLQYHEPNESLLAVVWVRWAHFTLEQCESKNFTIIRDFSRFFDPQNRKREMLVVKPSTVLGFFLLFSLNACIFLFRYLSTDFRSSFGWESQCLVVCAILLLNFFLISFVPCWYAIFVCLYDIFLAVKFLLFVTSKKECRRYEKCEETFWRITDRWRIFLYFYRFFMLILWINWLYYWQMQNDDAQRRYLLCAVSINI